MKVLLYSSGLDSELYRLLIKPDLLLFFRSNVKYTRKEEQQLQSFRRNGIINENVVIDNTFNFHDSELPNSVVPMRNIYYLLKAFEYGESIYLGVTQYDLHIDKQVDVINGLTTFVQTYYYFREIPETWDSVHPTVNTPYRTLTKGQLLKQVITEGNNIDHISKLRTCYDAVSIKGCGKCKSCVQKAMALAVNGLFKPTLFDNDPRKLGRKWFNQYIKEAEGTIDTEIVKLEYKYLLNGR